MFKSLTSVVIFFICVSVFSQEEELKETNRNTIKVGVKGGLSLPSLSDNSDNIYTEDFKSFASFEAGVFVNYGIDEKFSLQLEFNYAKKGGERNGFQPIPPSALEGQIPPDSGFELPDDIFFSADFKNRNELQYIEIPVLLKATINKNQWGFFANAGPYIGFLLKATQVTSGNSQIYFKDDKAFPLFPESSFVAETDVKDSLNDVNFGGIIGVGVTRRLNSKSELLFEVRGTYGFIPLQKDEKFGKSRVGSVLFSLGYVYTL